MGNCPDSMSKEAVRAALPGVVKVDLFKSGKSKLKNIGFVTFKDKAMTDAAIAVQFINIDGYMVRLKRYEKQEESRADSFACCFNCGEDHHLSACPKPLSCSYCLKGGHTFHVCPKRVTHQRGLEMGIGRAPVANPFDGL